MKEIELIGLDKKAFYEKLKNGLEIYLIPYDDKNNYFISYATKYGSDVLTFNSDDEEYTPPLGVAHYLEHKMFEESSGEDPFTFFSSSGTDSNASTSYDNTSYICYGNKNFKENLKYLIEFVNDPYFTNQNVNKEKGIIAEEIKMYSDIPDYKLEMKLRSNLYKKSSRKYDIAGTIEDINKITKDDLYKCYNAFYTPNNMFILISGNFNKDEALDVIKSELGNKEEKTLPKIIIPKEVDEVARKEETFKENIEIPKIGIGIKVPKKSIKLKGIELDLYLNMLTTILFGSSSEFRERVRVDKLLNDIYTEWEDIPTHKTFYLLATTQDADKLMQEVEYELNHLSVPKKAFERIKKVWIANEVKMIDNIERVEANYFDDIINYGKIISDRVELIRNMQYSKLEDLIKSINLKNKSIIKMINKEITSR